MSNRVPVIFKCPLFSTVRFHNHKIEHGEPLQRDFVPFCETDISPTPQVIQVGKSQTSSSNREEILSDTNPIRPMRPLR